MASYNELNALIDAYINQNGVQAITGQILNGVLKAMVEQLGRGYAIMGAATPTTDPGTPDGPETWFASEAGTYTDFDGLQIVPGELALLCYTPTDGWTKETIYEGFQTVGATIDGNVGTPSVGVSYANGVLTFDFHNMKGNTGDAAGFGTIGADIAGGVGTPGVSVESSGPATAKNLQFHFTNLKGETGVTSVVATVDNTTGNPACTVSLVGQQLTLAFSGLKGAQGDTGVSADYPIAIVNNLTTNDPASALSAAQGVVLQGEITQLEAKVSNITVEETESENKEIVILDDNDAEVVKVTEDGLSAKSLKVGATPVLTENDKLQAGENITIEGNVISADSPYDKEDTTSPDEEQKWTSDDGTETYAKVDKDGVHAKEFYYLNGDKLKDTIEAELDAKYYNENDKICNTPYNHSAIASFINKYIAKDVDEFNQLTLMMCGDSIFGRQAFGEGEMTPTPDVNTPGSTAIGYETGHFPPNMWVQNVPFKVLQSLQYSEADVKYFNHTASEVTKVGSWVDMYPNGADALRTVKTTTQNDSISLHFTGAKFAKVVISSYGQYTASANVAVTISENGGAYAAPDQFGLTESHAHTNSGEYSLKDFRKIKFAQLVFGGFDPSKTYDLKVTLTNSSYLNVWGFETWTRKRINVSVSAEGGNTANSQLDNPPRFYNEVLHPELCIMNMPFLNDCGTTNWNTWYKGEKEPDSAALVSPSEYDFIYCKEDGTYTNYGGIVAVEGDYIEYDGANWVLGSTKIETMYTNYRTRLEALMQMLKSIGTPMLLIATHNSAWFLDKPFIPDAANFMKLIGKKSGFASIDLFQYQKDLNITGIWSDNTHLNDNGVKLYADLISLVLNKDAEYITDGRAVVEYGCFAGHSDGGDTDFGFIMKNEPKVFLSNPSVSIASVSRTGFTVSGEGSYDYFVKS